MAKAKIRVVRKRRPPQRSRKTTEQKRRARSFKEEFDRLEDDHRHMGHALKVFQKELLEVYGDDEARDLIRMFRALPEKSKKAVMKFAWKHYCARNLH